MAIKTPKKSLLQSKSACEPSDNAAESDISQSGQKKNRSKRSTFVKDIARKKVATGRKVSLKKASNAKSTGTVPRGKAALAKNASRKATTAKKAAAPAKSSAKSVGFQFNRRKNSGIIVIHPPDSGQAKPKDGSDEEQEQTIYMGRRSGEK